MKTPTIAIVLKHFKDKNNEQTILLRITYQRKSLFKSLGIKTLKTSFKEKVTGYKHVMVSDPLHAQKNAIIRKEFEKLEKTFYDNAL